eukprot:10596093-Alexandrium_andersonii.AAC.1
MAPTTGAPSMRPCPRTRRMSRPMEGPPKSRRHEGEEDVRDLAVLDAAHGPAAAGGQPEDGAQHGPAIGDVAAKKRLGVDELHDLLLGVDV